jgi:hypothetical protein
MKGLTIHLLFIVFIVLVLNRGANASDHSDYSPPAFAANTRSKNTHSSAFIATYVNERAVGYVNKTAVREGEYSSLFPKKKQKQVIPSEAIPSVRKFSPSARGKPLEPIAEE